MQALGNLNLLQVILGWETGWTKNEGADSFDKCQNKMEVGKTIKRMQAMWHSCILYACERGSGSSLKEKPLLLTTFCQDKKSSHAIPFLQSSCAGKAPFFPMILVCFDWCLWKSLNSVRLSRVGQTNLAQKCQASINYHVSVSISAQCLDWKESRWIKQTLNSYWHIFMFDHHVNDQLLPDHQSYRLQQKQLQSNKTIKDDRLDIA